MMISFLRNAIGRHKADQDDLHSRIRAAEAAVDELIEGAKTAAHRDAEQAEQIERLEALVAVLLAANDAAKNLIAELNLIRHNGHPTPHFADLDAHRLVIRNVDMPTGRIDYTTSDRGSTATAAYAELTQP